MGLEVGPEPPGRVYQSKCQQFHFGVPFFGATEGATGVVDWFLNAPIVSYKGRAHNCRRNHQVKVEFLPKGSAVERGDRAQVLL